MACVRPYDETCIYIYGWDLKFLCQHHAPFLSILPSWPMQNPVGKPIGVRKQEVHLVEFILLYTTGLQMQQQHFVQHALITHSK